MLHHYEWSRDQLRSACVCVTNLGLAVKYPMHYVPETLMLGLSVAGVLALP